VVTAFWSGVGSSWARAWPAVTDCPTVTATEATVPEAPKLRVAWFTGVTVPTESRVSTTVPVVAVARR
jgi:hypothetical protein